MTKQETQVLKGVAILLMLFLHLFNGNVDLYRHTFDLSGMSIEMFLTKASGPVAWFLILSGFGLSCGFTRRDGFVKRNMIRLSKLFVHYWIICIIFVSIGNFLNPNKYPGEFLNILANISAFHTTWNGEAWFLFPYCALVVVSPLIISICRKHNWIVIVGMTFCLNVFTSYCISRFGKVYFYDNMLIYNPFLVLHLLPSFCLGVIAQQRGWFEKVKSMNLGNTKLLVGGG